MPQCFQDCDSGRNKGCFTESVSHYLAIEVTHLLQGHMGPLVHFNDLFIRDHIEASRKIRQSKSVPTSIPRKTLVTRRDESHIRLQPTTDEMLSSLMHLLFSQQHRSGTSSQCSWCLLHARCEASVNHRSLNNPTRRLS